jgi:hypothetical protein
MIMIERTPMHHGCFEGEHDWPASLEDNDEIVDAVYGIEGDFTNNMEIRTDLAARLVAMMESIAAGDCIGCRKVVCRISMLIEDLEDEQRAHRS